MDDKWLLVGPLTVSLTAPSAVGRDSSRPNMPGRGSVTHSTSLPTMNTSSSRRRSSRRSQSSRDNFANGGRWEWSVTKLKPIPPYYCLESTSMRFRDLSSITVSKRISNFLRVNSVCSTYHDDHIECITSGFLKCNIQLWEGNSPGEVVVEVQRRRGCALLMRKLRRGLFCAVTASEAAGTPQIMLAPPPPPPPLPSVGDCGGAQKKSRMESKHDGCNCTLKTAQRMLKSTNEDQKILGLQCLNSLVQSSMGNDATALYVAEALVCGTGKHVDLLRCPFMDFFRDTSLEEDSELFDDEDLHADEAIEYARGRHFGVLHTLALETLENCLKRILARTIGGSATKPPKLNIRSWFWRSVVEALIYNIEVADCRPLEAARSTKCLSLIMRLEPDMQHCRCIEERLIPGLVHAHNFGRAHHLRLETESQILMNTLY